MKHRAAFLSVCYLGVILYLSLSPWEFSSTRLHPGLLWDLSGTARRELLDAILNVGFYVPLGIAVACLFPRRGVAIASATAVGFLVSLGVELTQQYLPHRDPSYVDLTTNTVGSLLGAATAWIWLSYTPGRRPSHRLRAWHLTPAAALLTALWIASQTFPFMPVLRLDRGVAALHKLVTPSFVSSEMALGFVALFVLAMVVDGAAWLVIALAVLPAQGLIVQRMLSPSEIAGALAGLLAGRALRGRVSLRVTAGVVLGWLVWEELRPFHLGAPQAFDWLPFEGLMKGAPDQYGAIILLKLFLYGAVAWVLRANRGSWRLALGLPAVVLAIGEFAQCYLPDRTPETTDLVLLFVAAAFVRAAEVAAERHVDAHPVVEHRRRETPVV